MLAGQPGLGKSQLTIDLAATISKGSNWPDGTPCKLGSTLFICSEDDPADTIKPRLEAAQADTRKIHIIDGLYKGKKGDIKPWVMEKGTSEIESLCVELGDVRLIVIDPITADVGSKDGHSTSEVRSLLDPLMSLADRFNIAVIAVTHLNKNAGGDALTRVTGSGAYVAASRTAFIVGEHPNTEDAQCLAIIKTNLSKDKTGIGYRIKSAITDTGIKTSRVEWMAGSIKIDANDLVANKRPHVQPRVPSEKDKAIEFLNKELANGPMPSNEIHEKAKCCGISKPTLKRAKEDLCVKSIKSTGGGIWYMKIIRNDQEVQTPTPADPDIVDTVDPLDKESQRNQDNKGSEENLQVGQGRQDDHGSREVEVD